MTLLQSKRMQDLRRRSEIINLHKPDLAVSIHYNASKENSALGNIANAKLNYNMSFVPGGFIDSELAGKTNLASRIDLIRLYITSQIDKSLQLSESLVFNLSNATDVPIFDEKNDKSMKKFLEVVSIKSSTPGVYYRNLAITRLAQYPVSFIEFSYQNNTTEINLISKKDSLIVMNDYQTWVPERCVSTAKGISKGILDYIDVNIK